MRIAGREFLRIGEIDVDAGDVRIEAKRLQKGVVRLLQMAELFEHVAHIVVGVGEIGLEHKRAAVVGKRRFEIAALEGDAAHQVDSVVVVGVERAGALDRGRRLVDLVLIEQDGGVMHMELVALRLDGQRAAQQVRRLVEPFAVLEREREIVERVGIVGIELERLAIDALGLLAAASARAGRCRDCSRRRRTPAAVRARGDRLAPLRQSA